MEKYKKIAVLGTGNVGATIAFAILQEGVTSEVVLYDINKDKAEGEALDLSQCAACFPSASVKNGEIEDIANSDIVIVTFGVARKADQTRLDLAKINVKILTSVMPSIAEVAPNALYIIVANPVDVLTYATLKCTNLSPKQVIGTGTLLDSNRLMKEIADYCKVDAHDVSALVIGEHGDACMCPWSLATVKGVPMEKYCKDVMGVSAEELESEYASIYSDMVKSGATVIKKKGATYYAIAASVLKIVKAMMKDEETLIPLSTVLNGEYGAKDLCMGVPCVIGKDGLKRVVELPLTDKENEVLASKVASLNATYDALEIR